MKKKSSEELSPYNLLSLVTLMVVPLFHQINQLLQGGGFVLFLDQACLLRFSGFQVHQVQSGLL